MKASVSSVIAALFALGGCGGLMPSGGDACTLEAIGKEMGSDELRATLSVPEHPLQGAEIRNGGISVEWKDCGFPLNAFMSSETEDYVIANAPTETLTDHENFFRLVDASLLIWKFTDGSGETRFFVMRVQEMAPITSARNANERDHFHMPAT